MKTATYENGTVWKKLKNGRVKEWLWIVVLAVLLCVLAVVVFRGNDEETTTTAMQTEKTQNEQKLTTLLQGIDGVGQVDVMICEGEDGVESVVVVCDGAKDLRVIMDVREAVSAALGTQENKVKIYLKENN